MLELNITPMFRVQFYQEWTHFFFKPKEDFYNFVFIILEFENDPMLDLDQLTLGLLGFVICFKKNYHKKVKK